jgi:hypothetical protein
MAREKVSKRGNILFITGIYPFGLKVTFLAPEFWRMKGEKEASVEYGDEGHP